jgi:hypothetical protein
LLNWIVLGRQARPQGDWGARLGPENPAHKKIRKIKALSCHLHGRDNFFCAPIKQRNIPVKLSLYTGIKAGFLAQLTQLSAAILARRATADSTSSTARSRNDARRVL